MLKGSFWPQPLAPGHPSHSGPASAAPSRGSCNAGSRPWGDAMRHMVAPLCAGALPKFEQTDVDPARLPSGLPGALRGYRYLLRSRQRTGSCTESSPGVLHDSETD